MGLIESFKKVQQQHSWLHYKKLRKFFLFGVVGGVGTVINTLILYGLTRLGMYYLVAAAIATETAIVSNFIGNNLFTFRDSTNDSPLWKKFLMFQGVSMAGLVVTLTVLWLLTTLLGIRLLLIWNLIAILIAFLVNFTLNLRFTWAERKRSTAPEAP